MMTQKLILKATAVITLVGLSGGLLAKEQPKNKQSVYRIVGNIAQTNYNIGRGLVRGAVRTTKNPLVAFTLGTFVVAPTLRQTAFNVAPETSITDIAKKVIAHNRSDYKQAEQNFTSAHGLFSKWSTAKYDEALATKKAAFEKAAQVKEKAANKYESLQKNETCQEMINRAFEAQKATSKWASEKATALTEWFKNLRK